MLLAGGVVAAGLFLFTRSDDEDGTGGGTDEPQIRDVLRENVRALENNDLDAYMETIHPEAPLYDSTEENVSQLIAQFEIDVDLTIESIEVDGDHAEANVIQENRETSGAADYQDTRVYITHELRPYQGEWHLYDSNIRDSEPL